jgi:hypothetical protein
VSAQVWAPWPAISGSAQRFKIEAFCSSDFVPSAQAERRATGRFALRNGVF